MLRMFIQLYTNKISALMFFYDDESLFENVLNWLININFPIPIVPRFDVVLEPSQDKWTFNPSHFEKFCCDSIQI